MVILQRKINVLPASRYMFGIVTQVVDRAYLVKIRDNKIVNWCKEYTTEVRNDKRGTKN